MVVLNKAHHLKINVLPRAQKNSQRFLTTLAYQLAYKSVLECAFSIDAIGLLSCV